MPRIATSIFLLSLVGLTRLYPQSTLRAQTSTAQPPAARIMSDLSAEAHLALWSRHPDGLATAEENSLPKECVGYETPNMAASLLDPQNIIAIVVVTDIKTTGSSGLPSAVDLRVEEFLRGSSEQRELLEEPLYTGGNLLRVYCAGGFDVGGAGYNLSDPKVGDRYMIGYSFFGGDTTRALISGAIDLADHDQAQEMIDVQRFLDIEAIAANSNFTPLVKALDDQIHWVRDLAAQRLLQSKECNSSPGCRQAFWSAMRNLLSSNKLGDRLEGLHWTQLLVQPMEVPRNDWGSNGLASSNGLPLMSTDAVRDLLRVAVSDPSLIIGDEAYQQLEELDFYQTAPPGECLTIYPILRKSVRYRYGELEGVTFSGGSVDECTEGAPIGSD